MLHSSDQELREFVDLVIHEEAHVREQKIRDLARQAAERVMGTITQRTVQMPVSTQVRYREGPPSPVGQTFASIMVNLPHWIPEELLQFVAEEQIREQIYAFVHEEETQ